MTTVSEGDNTSKSVSDSPSGSDNNTNNTQPAKRRPVRLCMICQTNRAALKRPKTADMICRECFFKVFEDEVHETIVKTNLFKRGEKIAIAVSGGKDSTVLAEVLYILNERHNYGLDLFLLSVDEGITGYRDDSLESVKRNQELYKIPLLIVSYKELYGWTMDEIVREIGTRNNCTFCGVFRRQALDRGALKLGAARIVTGHNADDVAETVLMNMLRGDVSRLGRCVNITTGDDQSEGAMPRCKPFMYAYEKEIVLYAYYKKLDYFSTECIYSPNAYRGKSMSVTKISRLSNKACSDVFWPEYEFFEHARDFLKDLESIRPSSILDIIYAAQQFHIKEDTKHPTLGNCTRCGFISSNPVCKACVMLEGLNKGMPRIALAKEKHQREMLSGASNNNNNNRSTSSRNSNNNNNTSTCSTKNAYGAPTCNNNGCASSSATTNQQTCDKECNENNTCNEGNCAKDGK